jgi:hypothetical protein
LVTSFGWRPTIKSAKSSTCTRKTSSTSPISRSTFMGPKRSCKKLATEKNFSRLTL